MSVEEIFKKVDEEKFVTILEGMVLHFFIAVQSERLHESARFTVNVTPYKAVHRPIHGQQGCPRTDRKRRNNKTIIRNIRYKCR